jgi:hypothetical protein
LDDVDVVVVVDLERPKSTRQPTSRCSVGAYMGLQPHRVLTDAVGGLEASSYALAVAGLGGLLGESGGPEEDALGVETAFKRCRGSQRTPIRLAHWRRARLPLPSALHAAVDDVAWTRAVDARSGVGVIGARVGALGQLCCGCDLRGAPKRRRENEGGEKNDLVHALQVDTCWGRCQDDMHVR